MARTIPQRELRNDNARVIADVLAGETFVVTRNGEPVAELRPVPPGRRSFVPRSAVEALSTRTSRIDGERFRADLDAAVDPTV